MAWTVSNKAKAGSTSAAEITAKYSPPAAFNPRLQRPAIPWSAGAESTRIRGSE